MKSDISEISTTINLLIDEINHSEQSSVHLESTSIFLKSAKSLLLWCDKTLNKVWESDEFNDGQVLIVLTLIKYIVYIMMNLTLELCSGTTDKIPYPLALLIQEELNSISGKESLGVALYPVKEVNYESTGLSVDKQMYIERSIKRIQKTINSDIPESIPLGLVALGFHNLGNILSHTLLYHELGHYIVDKHNLTDVFIKRIEEKINETSDLIFKDLGIDKDDEKRSQDVSRLKSRIKFALVNWVSEMICDAIGVAAIGPQYVYSFASVHDIRSILENVETDLGGADQNKIATANVFDQVHPARAYRLLFQMTVLENLGWDKNTSRGYDEFYKATKENLDELSILKTTTKKEWVLVVDFLYPDPDMLDIKEQIVTFIDSLKIEIIELAKKYIPNYQERIDDYWKMGPHVSNCFENAIVPSSIIVDKVQSSDVKAVCPLPSTIINVARMHLRDGCKILRNKIEEEDRGDLSKSRKYIYQWTQKALEDRIILNGVNRDC